MSRILLSMYIRTTYVFTYQEYDSQRLQKTLDMCDKLIKILLLWDWSKLDYKNLKI
jgi:hypothetical protein